MQNKQHTAQPWHLPPMSGEILPPAPEQIPQRERHGDHILSMVVIGSMLAVCVLAAIALITLGDWSATSAVLSAIGFFTVVVVLSILTLTDTLTEWIRARMYTKAYTTAIAYQYQLSMMSLHGNQHALGVLDDSAGQAQRIAELERRMLTSANDQPERTSTFVAPWPDNSGAAFDDGTADEVQREAVQWVMRNLYRPTGAPLRAAVHEDGRLRIACIGSKRGPGSNAHMECLQHMRIIRTVPGGYCLNLREFPTSADLYQFIV